MFVYITIWIFNYSAILVPGSKKCGRWLLVLRCCWKGVMFELVQVAVLWVLVWLVFLCIFLASQWEVELSLRTWNSKIRNIIHLVCKKTTSALTVHWSFLHHLALTSHCRFLPVVFTNLPVPILVNTAGLTICCCVTRCGSFFVFKLSHFWKGTTWKKQRDTENSGCSAVWICLQKKQPHWSYIVLLCVLFTVCILHTGTGLSVNHFQVAAEIYEKSSCLK